MQKNPPNRAGMVRGGRKNVWILLEFFLDAAARRKTRRAHMPPQNEEQAHWFAEELQPHESMLRAWLRSQFPQGCDIDDIVQEAFMRVLTTRAASDVRSPRAFLFVTARNLALMQMRRRRIERTDSLTEMDAEGILDQDEAIPHAVARAQELELLTQAIQSLPTRCRHILTLRKIYGLSQKEVAAELGLSENVIEAQGAIGFQKIRQFFARHNRCGQSL
ncbi:MAG: RNA polymerase sigma factor [Opitutaceae bacterium]